MTPLQETLVEAILDELDKQQLNLSDLARKIHTSISSTSALMNGTREGRLWNWQLILDELNLTVKIVKAP